MERAIFKVTAALAVLMLAACSGDDVNQEPATVDPDTPEVPAGDVFTEFTTTAGASQDSKQSSPRRTKISGKTFVWTLGDELWVDCEGTQTTFLKNASSNITGDQPRASFTFAGEFPEDEYQVYYTGQGSPSSASGLKVNIASEQSAAESGDASHIATDGDCGTATATRVGNKFEFNLDHKAAYLKIFPYLDADMPDNVTLRRIEITATDEGGNPVNIAGTYGFTKDGLTATATDGTNKIVFYCNGTAVDNTQGFAMGHDANAAEQNVCYIVMHPTASGTPIKLSIDYVMADEIDRYFAITREVTAREYQVNSLTQIRHKLTIDKDFLFKSTNTYAQWDATGYYESGATYNTITSGTATNLCKDMPTYEAMSWYLTGDVYWEKRFDEGTAANPYHKPFWTFDNRVCTGGLWLQKWDNIPGKPEGATIFDCSTYSGTYWADAKSGRPSDTSGYFFLPALDCMRTGYNITYGVFGKYWSSSPNTSYSNQACCLYFDYLFYVDVESQSRSIGRVAGRRPDGTPWFQ